MRTTRSGIFAAVCAIGAAQSGVLAGPAGTAFTYQGQLKQDGVPVQGEADFEFHLWNAEIGGTELADNFLGGVSVDNGLFTVQLAFDAGWFDGSPRYLEVYVAVPSGGAMTPLTGRQPITPVPYALYAFDAPGGGDSWDLTGNAGTMPGLNFVGTTDDRPLELRVRGARALRIEPNDMSPNLIGGYQANMVNPGVVGATIGGGGSGGATNRVTDDAGTVGGGKNNRAGDNGGTTNNASDATVGGGYSNTASGLRSTVSGGRSNTASGTNSAVGGGYNNNATNSNSIVSGGANNNASSNHATVAGGSTNTASGGMSTVGGGEHNTANGYVTTIPGGSYNTASGSYSFAAGRRAQALDIGTFVWSDSTTFAPDYFFATGPNQFLIKATGGVGINTNAPGAALHIGGIPGTDGLMFPDGTLQKTAAVGGGGDSLWTESGSNIYYNLGNVGIGEANPTSKLHIVGPPIEGEVVQIDTGADDATALVIRATGASGTGLVVSATDAAVSGSSPIEGGTFYASGVGGRGLAGIASAATGAGKGVYGRTNSPDGYAGYFEGRTYFNGNVGIGETTPAAKLHIGGTPNLDGIMFPDGTLQTTAALGGGGGGDGHSLDAVDGNPVDAVFVDMNGNVAVAYDLRVDGELIAEGEVRLQDPVTDTDLASLTRNGDGHGRLVTFANGVSLASAVVGTDTEAHGAGGLVLLSFDDALGPAVKLDSVSNSGRATLARSTGVFSISETLVMFADAPEVSTPSTASGGGGIDLLNENGVRSLALRGADLGAGASIKGFGPNGGTVFSLKTGTSNPVLKLTDGSGMPYNQVELAVGSTGGLLAIYNSAGQLTVLIDGEDTSDGAGRVTTQKLVVTGGDLVMKDGTNAESVRLYADDPLGSHDGASLYLRDGTADGVALHADYNGTGFSRIISDVIEIRGGADLSEQFDVTSDRAAVQPGMVVAIDPDHPGKLYVADSPYDRKVAGIVSGAGGVRPGMLMSQQGSVADGKHPVALTGRVWTWCDASEDAIQPGDLLTTSNKPGHAMKVTDYDSAQGAIVGKAMTALKGGCGLVLVLVSLQ